MAGPLLSRRELARAWQIAKIIVRYGLVPLAEVLGLGGLIRIRPWGRMARGYEEIPTPVRLRLAIIELGTTFIKLGQVLSARSDLLPEEYLVELAKLQDDVPPLPFAEMEPVFRASFGVSPFDAFASFEATPIASASIGQVYRAQMHNGAMVVVKIQRPGVQRQVSTDLALMQRAAHFAHRNNHLQRFDLPALVREFRAILEDELLYTLEAHNTEALTVEMADRPGVLFPAIHWRYTTAHVLTMERIDGVKISDLPALDAMRVDRPALARELAGSLLEQVLVHGLFHGDPHPGNLLVTPAGRLAFLDMGMVGRLDRRTRELLIELAVAIFDQDIDAVLDHLQQLGVVEETTHLGALRRDLSYLITKYYFLPRRELKLGALLQRVNRLLFEHSIRMAYEFSLLAKALFVAEGIAQRLDPDFDYNEAARPIVQEVRQRYYSPESLVDDAMRELRGLRRYIVDLPRRVNTILTNLEQNTVRMDLVDDLFDLRKGSENVLVNRLAFAILAIGLLIGCALLLAAAPDGWVRLLALGGLIVDIAFIAVLLVALLRSGKI